MPDRKTKPLPTQAYLWECFDYSPATARKEAEKFYNYHKNHGNPPVK